MPLESGRKPRAVESPEQPKAPPAPRWRLRRSVDGADGTRAPRKALLTVFTLPAYAAGAHAADQFREQVPPPHGASLAQHAACVTLLQVTGSHSAKGRKHGLVFLKVEWPYCKGTETQLGFISTHDRPAQDGVSQGRVAVLQSHMTLLMPIRPLA